VQLPARLAELDYDTFKVEKDTALEYLVSVSFSVHIPCCSHAPTMKMHHRILSRDKKHVIYKQRGTYKSVIFRSITGNLQ